MGKNNTDGLHILKAEIKNFKNISYKEIEFDGRSMILAGRNQVGKSSMIQAICSPVNSNFIPVEPIKKGEEKGYVELTIGGILHGEPVKYHVGCYFSQEHSRGRLTLKDSQGTPIKGGERKILQNIIGDISFDIMNFIRMGRTDNGGVSETGVKKQIEILKGLMPKEVLSELHSLESERLTKYDQRAEINRNVKYLRADVEKSGFNQEDINLYTEPITAGDISEQIEKANKINDAIKKSEDYIKESYICIPENEKEIERLKAQIENLVAKNLEIKTKAKECSDFLAKKNRIDTSELIKKMDSIADHNSKHQRVKELEGKVLTLRKEEQASDELTKRLSNIETEKKDLFSKAKMPVKGLSFDENMVTYNGLPLSEDQIPTSQLIGIGLKIGMALNPNLRLLVIKDGSLLDNKTMEFILNMCDKHDYQLLIELVKHDGEDLTIEFIEKSND
jgi:hypothetical protein